MAPSGMDVGYLFLEWWGATVAGPVWRPTAAPFPVSWAFTTPTASASTTRPLGMSFVFTALPPGPPRAVTGQARPAAARPADSREIRLVGRLQEKDRAVKGFFALPQVQLEE